MADRDTRRELDMVQEDGEEERRERGIQAEAGRVAEGVSGERADDGAAEPADVEDEACAGEQAAVVAAGRRRAIAQDSSTISCASSSRCQRLPAKTGATETPMGA